MLRILKAHTVPEDDPLNPLFEVSYTLQNNPPVREIRIHAVGTSMSLFYSETDALKLATHLKFASIDWTLRPAFIHRAMELQQTMETPIIPHIQQIRIDGCNHTLHADMQMQWDDPPPPQPLRIHISKHGYTLTMLQQHTLELANIIDDMLKHRKP